MEGGKGGERGEKEGRLPLFSWPYVLDLLVSEADIIAHGYYLQHVLPVSLVSCGPARQREAGTLRRAVSTEHLTLVVAPPTWMPISRHYVLPRILHCLAPIRE